MNVYLILLAIVLLMLGNFAKVLRWKQFVEVYEETGRRTLLRSLSCGYIVNFFLPFHIGDLVRAYLAGRKMENGFSFSLATVILDRCLDVWVVGLIFGVMFFTGTLDADVRGTIIFYIFLALGLALLLAIAIRFNKHFKKLTKMFCSLFNSKIELGLLVFFWSAINAFKDMFRRLNKGRLLVSTICVWTFYLLSYYVIALALQETGFMTSFSDVFVQFFGSKQLSMPTVMLFQSSNNAAAFIMLGYIFIPLLILLAVSFIPQKMVRKLGMSSGAKAEGHSALHLLPQVNASDRLEFLEMYFETERRDYLNTYIKLNRDVLILGDFSAGSNATTMLCMDDKSTFYRKYAFGGEADKLWEQITWIREHKGNIPLPEICGEQRGDGYCSYDMPYYPSAIGMFQFLHSAKVEECWSLLRSALEDLSATVHQLNVRPADPKLTEQYIEKKILGNFAKIEAAHELAPLLHYSTLVINGRSYRGYPTLKRCMNKDYLMNLFSGDSYSDIHGDLTIENIVCWKKENGTTYYFIDPNTGSLHESPFLDYSKLLQSLHGGYEFLMRTQAVEVEKNEITYLATGSQSYRELFQKYREYLSEKFSPQQVRSIFFHEIVHWLRLMPYKIEKNGKRAVLFFAGMMIIFNDIMDWYGEEKI